MKFIFLDFLYMLCFVCLIFLRRWRDTIISPDFSALSVWMSLVVALAWGGERVETYMAMDDLERPRAEFLKDAPFAKYCWKTRN